MDVSDDIKSLFAVVTLKVFTVVVSVVIGDDIDKEDDSVIFELKVEIIGTEWVSWPVAPIEIVDDGNDDTVELTTLSVVIDLVVEVLASLIVVSLDDEMVLVSLSISLLLDCR
jgi:hypothetical protein